MPGPGHGSVGPKTKLLDNGPDAQRFNIVLAGDGFTQANQGPFDSACDLFVQALTTSPWYPAIGHTINVHKINVYSDQNGADEPAPCSAGTTAETYFDGRVVCINATSWYVSMDDSFPEAFFDQQFPGYGAGAVIVNTTKGGGLDGGSLIAVGLGSSGNPQGVLMHELGHAIGALADNYYIGGQYPPYEAPNLTAQTDLAQVKWRHWFVQDTPPPVLTNPDCNSFYYPQPNPVGDDYLPGLYASSFTNCGWFRPTFKCRMFHSSEEFCQVCVEGLHAGLASFATPIAHLEVHVAGGGSALEFGEVAVDLGMYRTFEVRNVRGPNEYPAALDVTLTLSGSSQFSLPVEASFRLPAPVLTPYTSRRVTVLFTAPPPGNVEFHGDLTVSATGITPATVTLHGRSVPPPPVDTVFVIDRSGSMAEPAGAVSQPTPTKSDIARASGQLYASLLRDGDRIGIVRYNEQSDNPADVVLDMQVAAATPGDGKQQAHDTLDMAANFTPQGSTSIGAGIINGSNLLADGGAAPTRAIIVLTDGIQNTAPDVPVAQQVVAGQAVAQRVFAVGFGLNQLETKLLEIAGATNGVAHITGPLNQSNQFLLQKLYVQILSAVSEQAMVTDPRQVIAPQADAVTDVWIGDVDVAADFIVVFDPGGGRFPNGLRVWLETPGGHEIKPDDVAGVSNAKYVEEERHLFFRIGFPFFSGQPDAHVGRWRIHVANATRGADDAKPKNVDLVCSAIATARSNLRLDGRIEQPKYAPGSEMRIVLEPTAYGLPVALDNAPLVELELPDRSVRQVPTARLDNGTYVAEFDDTKLTGRYLATCTGWATTPAGNRVSRYLTLTGIIFRPGEDADPPERPSDDKPGSHKRWCRWLKIWLARWARRLRGER
jgi:hypothetical protein